MAIRLERDLLAMPDREPTAFEAVIVLGKNFDPHSPDPRRKKLTEGSMLAVEAGVILYRQGRTPRVWISGGDTGGEENNSEAEEMKAYAQRVFPGSPDDIFLLENEAQSTEWNARKIMPHLREHGLTEVAAIVSGNHRKRAIADFRRVGVYPFPSFLVFTDILRDLPGYEERVERYEAWERSPIQIARRHTLEAVNALPIGRLGLQKLASRRLPSQ